MYKEELIELFDSHLDPVQGFFQGFFNIARSDIRPQFGSHLWKTDRIFIKIIS